MTKIDRSLWSEMYDCGVRIGTIIHVVLATTDPESPAKPMREFVEEDAFEQYVIDSFSADWPEYESSMDDLYRSREAELDEGSDPREAEDAFRYDVSRFFSTKCPKRFIVHVEFQIRKCISADPANKGMGSWRGGWGIYRTLWMLADDIEEAAKIGLECARKEDIVEWQKAVDEGRIIKDKEAEA